MQLENVSPYGAWLDALPQERPQESLAQLSEQFRPALHAYFLRRVRNHAEAEDLTQEVFLRLFRRDDAQLPASTYGYLFQTAANLLRDRARRQQIRLAYAVDRADLESSAIETLDPSRHAEGRAELSSLESHLRAMPERMRRAFILYRFEGVTKPVIADMLEVSVSTVEKDVAAALATLMSKMGRRS